MSKRIKHKSRPQITYLNTDLVLSREPYGSDSDTNCKLPLETLAAAFERLGVRALYEVSQGDDGLCYLTLETDNIYNNPEENINKFMDAIDAMTEYEYSIFLQCSREFDIGYDCGDEPWGFSQGIHPNTLERMYSHGCHLRITIYPMVAEKEQAPKL